MTASCGGCDATWTAPSNIAHCSAAGCHATFTTVANFDRHRAGRAKPHRPAGECHDPADSGLVLNPRGQWAQPGRETE